MHFGHLPDSVVRTARAAQLPGAQLAIRDGGQTWTFSFGETEHGSGVRMTSSARVPIGSITKSFTAALAMVLVSDGDLDLDEPVAEYVPELRWLPRDRDSAADDTARHLTSRHLLSHTGGLAAECAGVPTGRAGLRAWPAGAVQPPGAGFSYSNLGYALMGRLIEAVTGVSWWQATRDILLKPLGITPASVNASGDAGPAFAPGHSANRVTGRVRPVAQALEHVEAPAGALALSATDLVAFGDALCTDGGGLIDPAVLARMRHPVPHAEPFGLADGWGLGLALFRAGSAVWFGHDGTADGTSCHLRVDPTTRTAVALTTNASTGHDLWQHVVAELRSSGLDVGDYTTPTLSRRRVPPPPGCAGSYHNGDIEYTVAVRGDDLRLVVDGEPTARLVPHDGLVFSVTDQDGQPGRPGRFLRDSRGRTDRVQIGGRVARRQCRVHEVA